ncbi:MAG: hypothetical protein JXB49_05090 [Bacteroidales bacterium]|nr:hypothetical protein [Bacteroidales bacterium]
MKSIYFSLFADDDSNFVRAIADNFKYVFLTHNIQFEICMGIEELENHIIPTQMSNELLIAILDLWFFDKDKNENNENEGFEMFQSIREKWPNCFVIILSCHLNNGIRTKLAPYQNIAIIDKAISTSKLLEIIEEKIKSMGL